MPIIKKSAYQAPSLLYKSAHYSTIIPGLYRNFKAPHYERERLELGDGDFLDLDWLVQYNDRQKIIVLSHGLEGNSRRPYMNATANYFYERGYSVLTWNYRGCSSEINRNLRLYHHGAYDDLERVIRHLLGFNYQEIYLMGFSMGAAISLNYLGHVNPLDERVKGAVGISTPINLQDSARFISSGFNRIYERNFIKTLKEKIRLKAGQFPDLAHQDKIDQVKGFSQFDTYFTAPIHGFLDAADYYYQASPLRIINKINRPTLVINALNDPMLGEDCYPYEIAERHPYLYLETPKHGGHCGFTLKNSLYSWAEVRAFEFFESLY